MKKFIQRHDKKTVGVLSGLDRLRFRGTRRVLAHTGGMVYYLGYVTTVSPLNAPPTPHPRHDHTSSLSLTPNLAT